MTIRYAHVSFGMLALVCAAFISSCTSEEVGETLTVKFDPSFVPKQVTLKQDTALPLSATNPKVAQFDVIASVTYRGQKTLEYIWAIDSSNLSVGYTITPNTSTPNKATIKLTYTSALSAPAFDGAMPIKLLVKEKAGTISQSDTVSVDVYVYGGAGG